MTMQEYKELYSKLCAIHADVASIKTKQADQDRELRAVEEQGDSNTKFINKVKGGLVLISSGGIVVLVIEVVKRYML